MSEDEIVSIFAVYCENIGGEKACEFLGKLLVSTLKCAEHIGGYEAEFTHGSVRVMMDKP